MSNFWPSGLDIADTASPEVILAAATKEWSEISGDVITLVIQDAKTEGGDRLLIVHAKHVPSNRTVKLFSVVHRPNAPYPARIYPEDDAVPDYLRKSYYKPGFSLANMRALRSETEGHEVRNQWVGDTPAEFRRHLIEVFNQGVLKSEVLGLLSGGTSSSEASPDVAGATPPPEASPDAAGEQQQ
jgi:hypothetical protein